MLTISLQIHTAIASISHCEQSEQCREAEAPRPCHSPSTSPPYTRPLPFMSRRAGDRRTRERTARASYAVLPPHFSDLSATGLPRDPPTHGVREEAAQVPDLCSIHPSMFVLLYRLPLHPIIPLELFCLMVALVLLAWVGCCVQRDSSDLEDRDTFELKLLEPTASETLSTTFLC